MLAFSKRLLSVKIPLLSVCYQFQIIMSDRLDSWNTRWQENKTGWHLEDVNFGLSNYSSLLLPSGSKHRVFVPLCGKSVDLKWLYDAGHSVVGLEGIEKPCAEFFDDHSISYNVEEFPHGKIFKSSDGNMTIYCCDLFKIDSSTLGKFDAVWDRGSLVAINEEDRESYAELMKSLLADDFRYLSNIVQYTPTEMFRGPPRNIPTELVKQLFGDKCEVEILETIDRSQDEKVQKVWGLDVMNELVIILKPKQ